MIGRTMLQALIVAALSLVFFIGVHLGVGWLLNADRPPVHADVLMLVHGQEGGTPVYERRQPSSDDALQPLNERLSAEDVVIAEIRSRDDHPANAWAVLHSLDLNGEPTGPDLFSSAMARLGELVPSTLEYPAIATAMPNWWPKALVSRRAC